MVVELAWLVGTGVATAESRERDDVWNENTTMIRGSRAVEDNVGGVDDGLIMNGDGGIVMCRRP